MEEKEKDRKPGKEKKRKSIVRQVVLPLSAFIIILILVEGIAIIVYDLRHYLNAVTEETVKISDYTASVFEEYDAIDWISQFWHEHYKDMELIYNEEEGEELADIFEQETGYDHISAITSEEIMSEPYETQLLFAEIVYSRCSRELDGLKRTFKTVYSYSFLVADGDVFFLVTGTNEDEKRVSQGGDLFELGITMPYEKGIYPILDELMDTGKRRERFDKLYVSGGDRGVVHMYSPVYDKNGEIAMIAAASVPWAALYLKGLESIVFISLAMLVLVSLIIYWIVFLLKKAVISPITREQKVVAEYGSDKDPKKAGTELAKIRSNNEIQTLAENFSSMIAEIDQYTDMIREVTAEKEQMKAELAIAARIQTDTIPADFPRRPDFSLYAILDPAREVGGDFYDFFLLDDGHMAMFVGDVSGKGMPAALFMMNAKALMKSRCKMGGGPSAVLKDVNVQLIEENELDMFVTVWIAVIDLKTGRMIFSNAGHMDPVLMRAGGEYEYLANRHSSVVGVFPGALYEEYSLVLDHGDCLFEYSDGVTEASGPDGELFGADRLVRVLNAHKDEEMDELLKSVKKELDAYSSGAPQYDDITMMGFKFIGPKDRED
ncbi:MAG: serine/threonine-protein phosphatase [Lachnospiraceae bacterium]|nr:serine/threonine-protein phosphatase [Lachnospiraceae bacterium]